MAISELVNNTCQQKIWELKEWIRRGILFNECPSFIENLSPFIGGPLDGKLRMLPKPTKDTWEYQEETPPFISAHPPIPPQSPKEPVTHRYYKIQKLMVHSDLYANKDLPELWSYAHQLFERDLIFHLNDTFK